MPRWSEVRRRVAARKTGYNLFNIIKVVIDL